MRSRRDFIACLAAAASATLTSRAFAQPAAVISAGRMRGAIDAVEDRVLPAADSIGGRKLQAMINEAARRGQPLMLPPGTFDVSNLTLPDNCRINGVPGASRLTYSGEGHLVLAEKGQRIELSNLVLDGGNRPLGDYAGGLVHFVGIGEVIIDNCEIVGSGKNGLHLERCGGRISRCRISGAADAGLYAVQSSGLAISDNDVSDCGNGGILVHRWDKGEDGSSISGNRIARIGAKDGGTGQNGNGINVFRAGNVVVTDNRIADSAFTAIRANSASDVQISGNQCLRSGETAIFCEFEFEGAVVTGNLVDGAANGIIITNFDKGGHLATVTGNVVRNLALEGPYPQKGGFGIGIAAEADTVISGNTIENAPLWGLKLGWGPYLRNVAANGNIIRHCGVGCAVSVADGAGSAVIAGNLFEGTAGGAIVGFLWDKPASGDLAAGSSAYPQLTIEGNRRT